jgi:hypothetical protein
VRIIQAGLNSRCGLCGDRIEIGQDISPMEKRWHHTECVRGAEDTRHSHRSRPRARPEETDLGLAHWILAGYKEKIRREGSDDWMRWIYDTYLGGDREGGGRQAGAVAVSAHSLMKDRYQALT